MRLFDKAVYLELFWSYGEANPGAMLTPSLGCKSGRVYSNHVSCEKPVMALSNGEGADTAVNAE